MCIGYFLFFPTSLSFTLTLLSHAAILQILIPSSVACHKIVYLSLYNFHMRENSADSWYLHCEHSLRWRVVLIWAFSRSGGKAQNTMSHSHPLSLLSSCQAKRHQPHSFSWGKKNPKTCWTILSVCHPHCRTKRAQERSTQDSAVLNKPVITLETEGYPLLFELGKLI